MKFAYLMIFFSSMCRLVYTEELEKTDQPLEEVFQEDPESAFEEDQFIEPSSHFYFKVGTSIAYQEIGFGKRFTDLSVGSGHDFAFNIKISPLLSTRYTLPSLEYAWLFYETPSRAVDYYKYSGIGLEVGALMEKNHFRGPIPNPKIVWGKEYTSGRFSQWSLNLIPTVFFVFVVKDLVTKKIKTHNKLAYGLPIIPLSCMFEYSIGF